ncbi:MAG: protein kinase [Gemmataceae bacterium]
MTFPGQHDTSRKQKLNEIIAEYIRTKDNSEPPTPEALAEQHPEFAHEIRAYFIDPEHPKPSPITDTATLPPRASTPEDVAGTPTLGHDQDSDLQTSNTVPDFGDYILLEEIARGGMGVVFKAKQVSLNRVVALKMILSGQLASSDDVDRFRKEAEAAANLDHPNVVPIFEIGENQGSHYFSMKLVEGGSLADLIHDLSRDPKKAVTLMAKVANAVHHAHQRGILHRDLKPRNVLIDADNEPLVTDFGIAKKVEGEVGITQTGTILGTPSYMSPEQAQADKILTTGSDVYSLGAILYELLTGRPPFEGPTPLDIILQVINEEPVLPRKLNPQVDRDLETICLKCLAKESALRYGSAEAFAADLLRWLNDEPIHARPASGFERTVKWVRRHPTTAILSAVCVLAVVIGLIGVLYQWREAETSRTKAEEARQNEQRARLEEKKARLEAERQTKLAKTQAKQLVTQQRRIWKELHESNLLKAKFLFSQGQLNKTERILWQAHFMRPDEHDQRAYWQLWALYRKRPRVKIARWQGANPDSTHKLLGSNAKRIVTAKNDQLTIWDRGKAQPLASWKMTHERPHAVALAPNEPLVVVSYLSSDEIELWNFQGEPKRLATSSFPAHLELDLRVKLGAALARGLINEFNEAMLGRVNTKMMFLGNDRLWISRGKKIQVVETASLKTLTQTTLQVSTVAALATRPISYNANQGKLLLTTGGPIEVWTLSHDSGKLFSRHELQRDANEHLIRQKPSRRTAFDINLNGKQFSLRQPVITPDWKWLVAQNSREQTLTLWDFKTGQKASSISLPSDSQSSRMSPDQRWLALSGRKGIRVYTVPELRLRMFFPEVQGKVGWADESKQMVVLQGDRMEIYPLEPISLDKTLLAPKFGIFFDAQVTPKGSVIQEDPAIDGLQISTNGKTREIAGKSWFGTFQSHLCVSADENYAASVSTNVFGASVCIYDLRKNKIHTHVFLIHPDDWTKAVNVDSLAFFPGGEKLLAGTDQGLFVIDVAAKRMTRYLPNESEWTFLQCDLHPTGSKIVLVRSRKTKKLDQLPQNDFPFLITLETQTKKILAKTPLGLSEGNPTYSPDGQYILTKDNSAIRIYTATDLKFVWEVKTAANKLPQAVLSPNGRLMATWTVIDGDKIVLWDLKRKEQLATVSPESGSILDVSFSADGTKLQYVSRKKIGSVNLKTYEENMVWNLARSMPELRQQYGDAEVDKMFQRLRRSQPKLANQIDSELAASKTD